MKSSIGRGLFLVALVIPFSGCPTPLVSVGVWAISLEAPPADDFVLAVELLDDGTAQTPDPVPSGLNVFGGTISWEQNGSTITLTQTFGVNVNVYTGRVRSTTSIVNGTWLNTAVGGFGSGTWTGEKL